MKIKKRIFRVIAMLLMLICAITPITASAVTDYDNIIYTDYTYWETINEKTAVPTKAIYKADRVYSIANYGFNHTTLEPVHSCYDVSGKLYVLDSLGKIIVLNRDYSFNKVITQVNYNGEKLSFDGAQGIYVDSNNLMYICDTKNSRVLVCHDDVVEKILYRPKNSIIPDDMEFLPKRIVKDDLGYTYLLSEGCYYGLMVFNPDDEFLGFFGASDVAVSLLDAVTSWITSLFETGEKHDASLKELPYQIADISINNDGFVSSVNSETNGQIRVFSTTGVNILRYTSQFENGVGDSFNFADSPNSYVDKTDAYSHSITQSFVGVECDSQGYIYALDKTQGRIYVYDEGCNLLGVFGGGLGNGNQLGCFVTPVSISVYGDEIAVIDMINKNITVFTCTEYGKLLKDAQELTLNGEYELASSMWAEINNQDKNCQLAYLGLSKYYLSIKDYSNAMKLSQQGNDRVVYSQAFLKQRNIWLVSNLWWIVSVVIVLIAAGFALKYALKRKGYQLHIPTSIKDALSVVFHPFECFGNIRLKNNGSVLIATVLLILFYLTSIAQKLLPSFMYKNVELTQFNSLYTFLGTIGIMLLYVVVNWGVCILFEGKGKLKQIYCASCYCLIPQIFFSLLYVVLSYFVVPSNNSNMSLLSSIFTAILIIWLLLSITVIHDFSFFKAIGMAIVIVVGMAISVFVIFAVLTLAQDTVSFVVGIVKELMLF